MALQDHVGILITSALAEAVENKKKIDPKTGKHPLQFYARVALPAAAGADIMAIAQNVSPGIDAKRVQVKTNASSDNPVPGIPGDWLIVRASTLYAPAVYDRAAKPMPQETAGAAIKSAFYAGRHVRVELSGFPWNYDNKPGVSFNIVGIMDAGDGERMRPEVFAQYADASAPDQTGKASNGQDNPFGNAAAGNSPPSQTAASSAPAGGDNPFQQAAAGAGAANPFG